MPANGRKGFNSAFKGLILHCLILKRKLTHGKGNAEENIWAQEGRGNRAVEIELNDLYCSANVIRVIKSR